MVGIDIIDIARIDTSEQFLDKISLRHQRTGALFCVKEAVMKALEMGKNSGVVFKDIELQHEESGKPIVVLHGKALEKYNNFFSGKKIEVSLSHTPEYATAIAMII